MKKIKCIHCQNPALETYQPKKTDKKLIKNPKCFTYVKCYKCKKIQCLPNW